MPVYAVIRRPGPAFDPAHPVEGQEGWDAHAAFMMGLAAEGFVLMAGPLVGEGALLIVRGESPESIEARLAADPWSDLGLLGTDRIRLWDIRIGAPGQPSPI
jgi:hypothetical protein